MAIDVECDFCGREFQVRDSRAGTKINCPSCVTIVDVPDINSLHSTTESNLEMFPFSQKKKQPRLQKEKILPEWTIPYLIAALGVVGCVYVSSFVTDIFIKDIALMNQKSATEESEIKNDMKDRPQSSHSDSGD